MEKKVEERLNLNPLRMIRIAKDLSDKDLGEIFKVSGTYVAAIENTDGHLPKDILETGLACINISMDDYLELLGFKVELEASDIDDREKYKFMLFKTLGITDEKAKADVEKIIREGFYERNKSNTK